MPHAQGIHRHGRDHAQGLPDRRRLQRVRESIVRERAPIAGRRIAVQEHITRDVCGEALRIVAVGRGKSPRARIRQKAIRDAGRGHGGADDGNGRGNDVIGWTTPTSIR